METEEVNLEDRSAASGGPVFKETADRDALKKREYITLSIAMIF